jgi:hypothetical protein
MSMPVLEIDASTKIDLADVVTIDFLEDASRPLGERADLSVARGGTHATVTTVTVDSIPALQVLRQAVGNGTGDTRWVRIRREGTTGDHQDSYANLDAVGGVDYAKAGDGTVARLRTSSGAAVGEVHLPAALEAVRKRG